MIKTKFELNYYILEDARANGITLGLRYLFALFYGNVNACAYRYLKSLRKYEYYHNIDSLLRYWYRFYNRRLVMKYNMAIPISMVGSGSHSPHIG